MRPVAESTEERMGVDVKAMRTDFEAYLAKMPEPSAGRFDIKPSYTAEDIKRVVVLKRLRLQKATQQIMLQGTRPVRVIHPVYVDGTHALNVGFGHKILFWRPA